MKFSLSWRHILTTTPRISTIVPRLSTISQRDPMTIQQTTAILFAAAALLPAADKVTFSENVASIVYENCVTCHRPGEAAPFPLISYDDVRKRGTLIATVTKARYMPPWHAAHGY